MKKYTVLLTALTLAVLALILTGCFHEHDWKEATCEDPKTCIECGETEGNKAKHDWEDATCTTPKTCSECGEEKGDPLGHTWVDATCTVAKTCSVCSETEGEALGHDWKEATCTTPKTCATCEETEGSVLPHTAGDWVNGEPDFKTCKYTKTKSCTACGEEMESEEATLTALHDGETFLFNATQFTERLNYVLSGTGMSARLQNTSGSITCYISKGGTDVAAILLSDGSDTIPYSQKDTHGKIKELMILFLVDDSDSAAACVVVTVSACEPNASETTIQSIATYGLLSYSTGSPYIYNGLMHVAGTVEGISVYDISIE